jgi:hypothetical protein
VIRIDKAHGPALERIAEFHGVKRLSVWEPDRSLVKRSGDVLSHLGNHGTVLRIIDDGGEETWWAPIEWSW